MIAILTFRRPDDVVAAVATVGAQAAALPERYRARVVVVDNDPDGSARPLVVDGPSLQYVHEPTPGIAAARNRALREASADDVLVFIDDDERPSDGWLAAMLTLWGDTGAQAVAGRVESRFERAPDRWVEASRFFERRSLPTGTEVTTAATNNLLLDLAFVRSQRVEFAESLGRSGGEDTLFTRTLVARGGRIVWSQEAVVHDIVPAARTTTRFVRTRAFAYGCTTTRVDLILAPDARARARVRLRAAGTGLARLGGGGVRLLAGALRRDLAARAMAERTVLRGAGIVAGAFGLAVEEYGGGRARLRRV
ncbi:MAG: glycosyltransferase [Brevundimonas sp.]